MILWDCFFHLMFSGPNYIAACVISPSFLAEQWCTAWLETHSVYSCVSWWAFGLFPAYAARSFVLVCIFEAFLMAITSPTPMLSFTTSKACFFAVSHQIAVVWHLHAALLSEPGSGQWHVPNSAPRLFQLGTVFDSFRQWPSVLNEIPDNILFLRDRHWGCT